MQYDTDESGEFKAIKTDGNGYYGIAYKDGTLMNNRGTANGSAANMAWVVNTYSGNSVSDSGSRYKFTLVETYTAPPTPPSGIEETGGGRSIYSYTKEELARTDGITVHSIDGRQVPDVMDAAPGIYLVTKDGETYKMYLQ